MEKLALGKRHILRVKKPVSQKPLCKINSACAILDYNLSR